MDSFGYQRYCFVRPIKTSVVTGSIFAGLNIAQGAPFTPRIFALNIGGIYIWNVMKCPMEAIHKRQSAWHDIASGAILGYVGVSSRVLGIPFVDPTFFYRYPFLQPPMVGAAAYGTLGFVFASVLGGKPF